jgi:hypothetical protein
MKKQNNLLDLSNKSLQNQRVQILENAIFHINKERQSSSIVAANIIIENVRNGLEPFFDHPAFDWKLGPYQKENHTCY